MTGRPTARDARERYGDKLSKSATAEHYETQAYGVVGPPDSTLIACQPYVEPECFAGCDKLSDYAGPVS